MDVLHLPTVFHQLHCEPIEQWLITRLRASQSEIKHVVDQRRAEVTQPNVVDRDTSGQRVLAISEPFSKRETATRALMWKLGPQWLILPARLGQRRMRGGERGRCIRDFLFGRGGRFRCGGIVWLLCSLGGGQFARGCQFLLLGLTQ